MFIELRRICFVCVKNDHVCVILGDELFSDAVPVELIHGTVYKVKGKVCIIFSLFLF